MFMESKFFLQRTFECGILLIAFQGGGIVLHWTGDNVSTHTRTESESQYDGSYPNEVIASETDAKCDWDKSTFIVYIPKEWQNFVINKPKHEALEDVTCINSVLWRWSLQNEVLNTIFYPFHFWITL